MPSLTNSHQVLLDALRDLRRAWYDTGERWDDEARREFQAQFIDVLDPSVRAAAHAILEVNKLLRQVERDCGSR